LSYGVYIWAWPVQQVTRLWMPANQPMWQQLLAVTAQVLLVAFLSWHLVEKRALRMKPSAATTQSTTGPWWRLEVGSIRETRGRLAKVFRRQR